MRVFIQGTRGEGHFGQRDRKKERPEVRNRMSFSVKGVCDKISKKLLKPLKA